MSLTELQVQFVVHASRFGVVILLVWAALSDIRSRRIPNLISVLCLCTAIAFHVIAPTGAGLFDRSQPGSIGLGASILGFSCSLVLFVVLHAIGAMGAGDAKLMAVLGAVFGPAALPGLVLSVFAAGGLLVLFRIFDAERRRRLLSNLWLIAVDRLNPRAAHGGTALFDPRTDTADRLPFAVSIALGSIGYGALLWKSS
jgi:prepilin peptidase CpaA